MNALISLLRKYNIAEDSLYREGVSTLQVNMGNLCNQVCRHCHIGASPSGDKNISREVVDDILSFLKKNSIRTLDITGGAPEMNENFEYFVESARPFAEDLIVRSNLTILTEPGREHLPEFFRKNNLHIISSLPCYTRENVDKQRGFGVFEKSIAALKILNELGFGKKKEFKLDLVYNPGGAYLPLEQSLLEENYKTKLRNELGIVFNNLLTITNVPVNNFKEYLDINNEAEDYFKLLKDNFNLANISKVMCKNSLSVGYDGSLYDCDFNLSIGTVMRNSKGEEENIKNIDMETLKGKAVLTADHCIACTAGNGSSCQGSLKVVQSVEQKAIKGNCN